MPASTKRKIGKDSSGNQKSLFNFFEKKLKEPIGKKEKQPVNDNCKKPTILKKRVCEDPERMNDNNRPKIENVHVQQTDQSKNKSSQTAVSNTSIEESKNQIFNAFK